MSSTVRCTPRSWLTVSALALLAGLAFPAEAQEFARFLGDYEGRAVSETNGEVSPRDIHVTIKRAGKGFSVDWTTVIYKADGRVKRAQLSIDFEPTRREGIYSSAMRKNLFGKSVPMDPLKGDPYVWARIDGDTLSVYALIITDEGGYELQTHERTLTADGMDLRFNRVRDGEVLRTVTGTLVRVG